MSSREAGSSISWVTSLGARQRAAGRRALIVALLVLALVYIPMSPASAGPRVNCAATGKIDVVQNLDGTWAWPINGVGLCLDFLQGPYQVAFNGVGSSSTLGLCDGLLVTNLRIDVNILLFNVRTAVLQQFSERWQAAFTTFPIATPFFITQPGALGAGVMSTRILLGCPPAGTSGASFVWTQATP